MSNFLFASSALSAATPDVAITTEMLMPIVDSIKDNIAVIIPVGIIIFGIMIGIRLVPAMLRMFTHS